MPADMAMSGSRYGFAGSMMGFDPYSNGAWMFYPGMGYSFASSYPWGWLPYHYGSWAFINGAGWAWVPGRYSGQWVAVSYPDCSASDEGAGGLDGARRLRLARWPTSRRRRWWSAEPGPGHSRFPADAFRRTLAAWFRDARSGQPTGHGVVKPNYRRRPNHGVCDPASRSMTARIREPTGTSLRNRLRAVIC